jgi:hypothetical protein
VKIQILARTWIFPSTMLKLMSLIVLKPKEYFTITPADSLSECILVSKSHIYITPISRMWKPRYVTVKLAILDKYFIVLFQILNLE